MSRRDQPARFAGLRDGDLIRRRDPMGLRVIIALSLALVIFLAVQVFAHTIDEVKAMPRHLEGFP